MSTDPTPTGSPGEIPRALATWALNHEPSDADRALADRSLLDTVAVALAARGHPIDRAASALADAAPSAVGTAGRWATLSHVLDFDDLHLPSTAHLSTVCVPVALATATGDVERARRSYLAGAGVMARLGIALGWRHYTSGWHATTTAGAPAAAVTAGLAMGLSTEQLTHAIALAIPAAGGVQRAFGTDAKSLQVGMAAAAGVTAARLAAAGARSDPRAVASWLSLVAGDPDQQLLRDPAAEESAIPGGLAIKIYPACYALQRPIAALREAIGNRALSLDQIDAVQVTTPGGTVTPLVHSRPTTGLEGKFSLEYAVATALLDAHSGFAAFEDDAVRRNDAQRLIERTAVVLTDGGDGLLDGSVDVEVQLTGGDTITGTLDLPPGSPGHPVSTDQLAVKVDDCLARGGLTHLTGAQLADELAWDSAAALLTDSLSAAQRP